MCRRCFLQVDETNKKVLIVLLYEYVFLMLQEINQYLWLIYSMKSTSVHFFKYVPHIPNLFSKLLFILLQHPVSTHMICITCGRKITNKSDNDIVGFRLTTVTKITQLATRWVSFSGVSSFICTLKIILDSNNGSVMTKQKPLPSLNLVSQLITIFM